MTIKKQSLYEAHTAAWDNLAKLGCPNLCEMAKYFHRCADMDRALGFMNASARWHRGEGVPSRVSEVRAKEWIEARDMKLTPPKLTPPEPAPQGGSVLLVACNTATVEKVKRVLAVLGCEVTEV